MCFNCLIGHFEIGKIEAYVDISAYPFNFSNMSSKFIANLATSRVTLTRCAITVCWNNRDNRNNQESTGPNTYRAKPDSTCSI